MYNFTVSVKYLCLTVFGAVLARIARTAHVRTRDAECMILTVNWCTTLNRTYASCFYGTNALIYPVKFVYGMNTTTRSIKLP